MNGAARIGLSGWATLLVVAAVGVWLVMQLAAAGNAGWAVGVAGLFALLFYVYLAERGTAWRYLLPGVAAMLAFIAFPLAYTMQIGFTNYSSNNLLGESRARAYLLDQHEFDEQQVVDMTVVSRDGTRHLLLGAQPVAGEAGAQWLSDALPSNTATTEPLAATPIDAGAAAVLAPLSLRDVVALRDTLRGLTIALPDGRRLTYAGLRDFGVAAPLWRADGDDALVRTADGVRFVANRTAGFFEAASGERVQPGFKVNIGWRNYARLFGDADMRGPFVSIFVWTVVFAGLTVLFSTVIGMTLAVVLNWEALRFRGVYRTLLFLPYAVPGFISILVFKGLFNQNFGEINAILDALVGIRPAWFADPLLAKVMILIVNTWLGYPYIMVLCTGLIKAIPADLYEASAIAGAGPLTNFWRITAPLIAKPLTPLLISAFAFNFNNFVLISLLTDGRPDYLNTKLPAGTNDILVSYTYRIAFTDAGQNFGLAAAISTVIFLLVAAMSLVNLRLTKVSGKA